MKVDYFCPLWGSEHLAFDHFCERARKAGFDGVELALPLDDHQTTDSMLQSLKDHGLKLVAQHWETIDPDIDEYIAIYKKRLEWQAAAHPEFINSQTGRDWFAFENNQRIIDAVRDISENTGVKIVHETHRGTFSFCAAQTCRFLEAIPDLRLTADFSHWCTVSESLLEDQAGAVDAAIDRADHIHTRVGHPEGPQVSDPRAPEWQDALNVHLAWWDAIVQARKTAGAEQLTITPEFGPDPYMPALPFTNQPVADQWDINVHMMNLLKERWSSLGTDRRAVSGAARPPLTPCHS